jgi:hypothetical protein
MSKALTGPILNPYHGLVLVLLVSSAAICLVLFGPYTGDSERYLILARNLSDGIGFSAASHPPYYPEMFRPPMYPLFLAGPIRLGLGIPGILAIQVVLYFVAILLTVQLTVTVTGSEVVAKCVGLLLACYLPLVHWIVSITTETLCVLFFCGCSAALIRHLQAPSWWNTTSLGVSVVGLFLTRVSYLALLPVVVGLSLFRLRKRGLHYSVVLALITVVPIAGWITRNLTVMPGSFNPLGFNTGIALWARAIELTEPNIAAVAAATSRNADFNTVHSSADPLVQAKADERLSRWALGVIRSDQWGFLRMTIWALTFREWIEGYDPRLPTGVLWMATAVGGALLLLAYVGVLLLRNRWSVGLPLLALCVTVAGAHAPFLMEARYTAPVRPMLYIFSAFAGVRIAETIFRSRALRQARHVSA